jgi:hypothetical protein
MRFVITGFGDKYLEEFDYGMVNKIVTIPDWIAEKNDIPRVKEAMLLWQTEKAYSFLMKGKTVWIPKSLCTLSNPPAKNIEEWTERYGSD